MAKPELSNLVQAMNLYDQLDERDRAHLADYVRSKTTSPKESTAAPSVEKKSSRKGVAKLRTAITEAAKGSVSPVSICGVCGNEPTYVDHFPPSPAYHEFETKKVKTA